MYFLSKTLGNLCQPVGFIWLVLIICLIRALNKREKQLSLFIGSLTLLITVVGSTKIPAFLLSTLEKPYAVKDLNRLPECDAVVLLGGTHNFSSFGVNSIEVNQAFDRVITAVELVRLNKGKALVIGGGEYSAGNQIGLNGQLVADWLVNWKLIDAPIHVLEYSSNTKDESMHTMHLAKKKHWKKIILVTSAWHMRRSEALFSRTELEIFPVGADFEGISSMESDYNIENIIPTHKGFKIIGSYLHEQVGWLYYKLRGWI
jgi:uncharacterized SAM-binding protein YcdF (DUF218 family)